MQPRTVKVSFPAIAAAIKEGSAQTIPSGSLENRAALRYSLRFIGPSLLVAAVIVVLFGVVTGRFGPLPLPLVSSTAMLALLAAVIIPSRAPKTIDLSPEGMLIRGYYRKRQVRSEEIVMAVFTISMKEAGRPEHERFFDTRLTLTTGKKLIVGWVREGVVADLTRWLPHSKVTIRVIGYRGGVQLRPRDFAAPSGPNPPGS